MERRTIIQRPGRAADVPPGTGVNRRPDIEGLRAIAVLLVVLDHIDVPGFQGGYIGVDTFFVISGFLITAQLVREVTTTGTLSIRNFYTRRALRLLPASTLTVIAVVVAATVWLPLRLSDICRDALAAAAYCINLLFAASGLNYFTSPLPSPLQHFWSLAVEEQFYLCWPLLVLITWRLRGRRVVGYRAALLSVLTVAAAASFAVGVWQTRTSAPWAYFGTAARVWELAVGAIAALAATRAAALPRHVAAPLTWAGLSAILVSALVYTESTPFPGVWALAPVLGTASVIVGGCAAPSGGAEVLLRRRPLQGLGGLSYSWYLWHWPVIIFAPLAIDRELVLWERVAAGAGSLALAAISLAAVENPVRGLTALRRRPLWALALGACASAATAATAILAVQFIAPPAGPGTPITVPPLATDGTDPTDQLRSIIENSVRRPVVPASLDPGLGTANAESPYPRRKSCYAGIADVESPEQCVFGDPDGTVTVVLVGDSHARHWIPGLDVVARERHWRLIAYAKSACPAADATPVQDALRRAYLECHQWRERTIREIRGLSPAVVVLSSSDGYRIPAGARGDADRIWAEAWRSSFRRFRSVARTVVLLQDTPRIRGDVLDCVSRHLTSVQKCGRPRDRAIAAPLRRRLISDAALGDGVIVIDPVDWFCTASICPPIVGNTVVFRDGHHMTSAYSKLLAPLLDHRLGSLQPPR